MPEVLGRAATYDLPVGIKLDFEDAIHLISPFDVPLLGGVDAGGGSVLTSAPCFEKKVEWQDEELLLPKSTCAATLANTTASTVLTVASGHRIRFSTGDEILTAGTERMRVTGYGTTADTLLVTRAFDSSTIVTVATDDVLTIIGTILAEGADPENARSRDRTTRYNVTQIFGPTAVHVTASENAVKKYGLTSSEFDKQAGNRLKEEFIKLEQAILYGSLIEDSTNEWRAMGGMKHYIATNVDSSTTVFTETAVLTQLQAMFDAGGGGELRMALGSKQKRVAGSFTTAGAATVTVNMDRSDRATGRVIDYIDSDFGRVSLLLDRNVRKADAFLWSRDQAEVCTLRPLGFEMLAKTGDSEKGQIVGEKSLRFRKETHAARFSALT